MNKYPPHNYDPNIPIEQLHYMIDDLQKQVNGLLSDSARNKIDIEQLRGTFWNKPEFKQRSWLCRLLKF